MKETGPAAGSCEQVVAKDSNIIGTRVTTAKVESSNTMIRNIKKILAGSAPPKQPSIAYAAEEVPPGRWREPISAGCDSSRNVKSFFKLFKKILMSEFFQGELL